MVVHGRDRLLSSDGDARRRVAPPRVDRVELGDEVVSVAIGAFAGDEQVVACLLAGGEVVLVDPRRSGAGRVAATPHHVLSPAASADGSRITATQTSAFPGSDLLLVEPAAGRLELVPAAAREAGGERPAAAALEVAGKPVAVLPLRLNKDGLLDLVVAVDRPPAVAVVLTGPRAVFVVNTPDYAEDQTACDGVCDNGAGLCSTTAASAEANCTPAADEIRFAVGAITSGPNSVVSGGSAGGPLTVDGTSFGSLVRIDAVNIGVSGSVVRGMDAGTIGLAGESGQFVEGNLVSHGGDGIVVTTSNCTVGGTTVEARNVVIQNSDGIWIRGDGNVVIGNHVGVDATGASTGLGNTSDGVVVEWGSDNTIGGTTVARRNLISSNQRGVTCEHLAPDNLIQGNYIGTDSTGTLKRGNSHGGVILLAGGTTVGGTVSAARNVIAGGSYGVRVSSVTSGDSVLIQGNRIGTNAGGSAGLGFDLTGVGVESSSGVRVGGEATGAGNLISGVALTSSWAGIAISGATSQGNTVQGNLVGTDSSGTVAIPNYRGVRIVDSDTNTIGGVPTGPPGGPCVPPCNLISGSTLSGVTLSGDASGNLVIGNFIGTDLAGMSSLANAHYGVDAAGSSNSVGVAGAGNLISGNQRSGIWLRGTGNRVHDNLIGTDSTGAAELGNVQYGLWVNGANAEIGAVGAGNVISGNTWPGILLDGASGASVKGNLVGTQADGETPLGNRSTGIWLFNGASGATIGGLDPADANVVAHNTWAGIRLEGPDYAAGTGNRMLSNVIHSNGALGIDLGAWGPEPNDPLDPDTGPNQLQNYPKLTAVSVTATDTAVQGFLDSLPSTAFTLQLFANQECDPSGYGEAEVLLGTETVVTDAGGHGSFSLTFPAVVAGAHAFTATATDPDGNTSELSACQSDLPGADVETTKTGPATVEPGQTVEYVVRAVNIGVGYAFGVEISDDLPACLTNITCAVSTGACVVDGSSVTASVGTLEPDEEAVLTITAQVGPTCIGVLTNTAVSFCLEDLNPSNDDDDVQTMVGLFSDGFASGDTTGWSSSVP